MFKRFALTMVTGLVLAGCGAQASPSLAPPAKVAKQISAQAIAANGWSGVGNPYSVSLQSHGGPAVLYINYDDRARYFTGWDTSINAYVKVWTRSGQVIEVQSISLHHPSGGTSVYGGYATLHGTTGPQDVAAAELAFFRQDRWDSNFGRNYRVTF